ncbi:MAG: stage III sporulation protein AD [Oscillospiraceae bacterium]|jgi:stage III sporulation protein AD|nr:stage III sporulation protein AD [Oscillospiraceae bacterium]
MEILVKAAAIGVSAAVLALVVKKHNADLALMISLAAGIAIMIGAAAFIAPIIELLNELATAAGIDSALLSPVLKALGIAVVGRIASDVCADAGQSAVAGAIEFCASLAGLICAVPLIRAVLEILRELMR